MIIYLAGGITGNLNQVWKNYMQIYLAGSYSRPYCLEQAMKIYLAATDTMGIKGETSYPGANGKGEFSEIKHALYILESFYYIKDTDWIPGIIPHLKGFMLDSGAYTFMQNTKISIDWDKYVEAYAEFINKYNIDLFFELDIDNIVGIKEVERLRSQLEAKTGKQCIPVFHRSRGMDYWRGMIKEYKYVGIGGIVSGEITSAQYPYFTPLLKMARQEGCKVHGLGFTNLSGLEKYPFYSVDSTAWLYGNRGGFLYHFNGRSMGKIMPKGKRLNSKQGAIHNFNEWIKFATYAEKNL